MSFPKRMKWQLTERSLKLKRRRLPLAKSQRKRPPLVWRRLLLLRVRRWKLRKKRGRWQPGRQKLVQTRQLKQLLQRRLQHQQRPPRMLPPRKLPKKRHWRRLKQRRQRSHRRKQTGLHKKQHRIMPARRPRQQQRRQQKRQLRKKPTHWLRSKQLTTHRHTPLTQQRQRQRQRHSGRLQTRLRRWQLRVPTTPQSSKQGLRPQLTPMLRQNSKHRITLRLQQTMLLQLRLTRLPNRRRVM
mmetsp:Transcript_85635/g.169963  ORF Transcript_85635/g.169963 Transcript_85635/m.169963 type:complete len:241 (+) Transcript_85635:1352-2074(+)